MLWRSPDIRSTMDERQFRNIIAMTLKELEFALNGNMDSRNTREIGGYKVSLTSLMSKDGAVGLSSENTDQDDIRIWAGDADRDIAAYRVTKSGRLVATNAHISGRVTASEFIGGTITGALIQTGVQGNYPRIALSPTNNLLLAERDAYSRVILDPGRFGDMGLIFESPTINGTLTMTQSGVLVMGTSTGSTEVFGTSGYVDIWANLPYKVRFTNWDNIYSYGNNQTLQDAITAIWLNMSGLSDRISALGG